MHGRPVEVCIVVIGIHVVCTCKTVRAWDYHTRTVVLGVNMLVCYKDNARDCNSIAKQQLAMHIAICESLMGESPFSQSLNPWFPSPNFVPFNFLLNIRLLGSLCFVNSTLRPVSLKGFTCLCFETLFVMIYTAAQGLAVPLLDPRLHPELVPTYPMLAS